MAKVIAHIDLNAFFAACETLRDPSLKGKPLIIGGTGRAGIVSTCSYKAREYGIHSGMPTFQAIKLCPHVIIKEPDFTYYKVMSNSFFSIVRNYTKLIEVASIDECFADFTTQCQSIKDPVAYFQGLQNTLYRETGLGASIGVAPTKWLAKMASDMNKPMGLTFCRRRNIEELIYPLPIESFWGIGKKTSPILRSKGISTIGDLAKKVNEDDPEIQRILGKFFFTVKEWINGRGEDSIDMEPFDPKSIGASTTLPYDTSAYSDVEPYLRSLCKEVSERAKKAKKVGSTITLTVKDTVGSFHLHTRASTISNPTDKEEVLFKEATKMYLKEFDDKMEVRLVGVSLSKLVDKSKIEVQMTLWNYEEYEEMDKTKLLINELNRKLDKPMLERASKVKKGGGPK